MGGSTGSVTETRRRKGRIEDRSQDLSNGLLDQTIQHRGYPQRAFTTHAFGNLHTANRQRIIRSCQKRGTDSSPMLLEIRPAVVNRHLIDAMAALVGLDLLPGREHILTG